MAKEKKIMRVSKVNDHNKNIGAPELHSLVSVVHLDELPPYRLYMNYFEVYGIYLNDSFVEDFVYGTTRTDFHPSSLICNAPRQAGGRPTEEKMQLKGWSLLFDPALCHGTDLGRYMARYTYFLYDTNEPLLLSEEQRQTIVSLFEQIRTELQADSNKEEVNPIVMSCIVQLLEYISRFYAQQHASPNSANMGLLNKFEDMLMDYFRQNKAEKQGLPSVKYFADQMGLSANYFGDLVRNQTGETAANIIVKHTMELAYTMLVEGKSVSVTAETLGFQYPQHFSRAFKKHYGKLPSQLISR